MAAAPIPSLRLQRLPDCRWHVARPSFADRAAVICLCDGASVITAMAVCIPANLSPTCLWCVLVMRGVRGC